MISLARTVNRFLRRRGVIIRRSRFPLPRKRDVDPEELRLLASTVDRFVSEHGDEGATRRKSLEEYLTFTRLAFYHNVIALCREAGVEFDNRDVADIGTGFGYLCRLIRRESPTARIFGFDLSSERLKFARALCEDGTYQVRELMQMDGSFDVVFLTEVLEHLPEPEEALQKLLSLIRFDGWVVLTVPNGREDNVLNHINFWSPESWRHFIELNIGPEFQPTFGQVRNGNNFVAIRRVAGDTAANAPA